MNAESARGNAPQGAGRVGTTGDVAGIDSSAVSGWFETIGVEYRGALHFSRIGMGQSNLTYLVADDEGGRWILRRPPLGHLLESAHDVAREARIMSALEPTEVPTPRVLGLTTDPAVSDAPLLLLEFVDGIVLDTAAVAESLPIQRRYETGLSLSQTLAKIHAVDLADVGLSGLASNKPYVQRQLKRWSRQWGLSRTRDVPDLDKLTQRLVAAAPTQQTVSLVHGDFHIRNVITSRSTGEVSAVLDWELSTLGEPLADMGSLLAYWEEAGENSGPHEGLTALGGFPSRAELTTAYLEATGYDEAMLQYWHAMGLWKLAIIGEGVIRRARDEPKNKAMAGTPTIERIDALIARAMEVADAAGI